MAKKGKNKMSTMAKGTVRLQLTAAQVKVIKFALKTIAGNFDEKQARQAGIVLAKLKK